VHGGGVCVFHVVLVCNHGVEGRSSGIGPQGSLRPCFRLLHPLPRHRTQSICFSPNCCQTKHF
jgi:hypothetical protein